MVTAARYTPIPLYDSVDLMTETDILPQHVPTQFHNDYRAAKQFLLAYQHNPQTFKRYRSEIERFSQWCWFFAYLPFAKIEREDIENYIRFCQKPPNAWIGIKQVARFIEKRANVFRHRHGALLSLRSQKPNINGGRKFNAQNIPCPPKVFGKCLQH